MLSPPATDCSEPDEQLTKRIAKLIHGHRILRTLKERWDQIGLPDVWLSGSLLAQARWNQTYSFDADHGINDADIVYFDPEELSEHAEQAAATQVRALFADLPVQMDVKNQARVHLWYGRRFGHSIRPYTGTKEAITTFPTTAASVGMRRSGAILETWAPFGVADLLAPVVRANATQITPEIYAAKTSRWQVLWPDLRVLPWSDAVRLA